MNAFVATTDRDRFDFLAWREELWIRSPTTIVILARNSTTNTPQMMLPATVRLPSCSRGAISS